MSKNLNDSIKRANNTRYAIGQKTGHYESYFLRANQPDKSNAFWIRYTIFNPKDKPENAIGELWATYFNGETDNHISVKEEMPITKCNFNNNGFDVAIGKSILKPEKIKGQAQLKGNAIKWEMDYTGQEAPLFLLPLNLYNTKLPKAKSIVSLPMACFNGYIQINADKIKIQNWIGSQNHNWGLKHTDHYAWGQVAGFDNEKDSFLEIGTARLKFGPIWTPFMTVIVLRHEGKEYACNSIKQSFKAKGKFNYFTWDFYSEDNNVKIKGAISAKRENFAGLTYYNPPGGKKICLNTKIASCKLTLNIKERGKVVSSENLETQHRAAFEILTDDKNHGVKMYV